MADGFICAKCKQKFNSQWSEEEARSEYEKIFDAQFDEKEVCILCDECFAEVMDYWLGVSARVAN